MSVIDKSQGAIKLSEVAVDNAQPVINTVEREDGLTVIERLRRLVTDSFRRHTVLLASSATISWTGGSLQITDGVSITLLLLAAPDSASASFNTITYTSSGTTNWAIDDGDIVYIELERSLLDASGAITLTDGINSTGTVGCRIRKAPPQTIPFIDDLNDGSPQGTLMIPIAVRHDSYDAKKNLWWVPHGILWSDEISGILGRISTTTTIPIGAIIPIHIPNVTNVGLGPSQAVIDFYAPGFQLCDGLTVTNPSSPLLGEIVPNLNGPLVEQLATVSNYNPNDTGGQRFLRGGANSSVATSDNSHASVGGKTRVVLSAATLPSHSHTVSNSRYPAYGFGISHEHGTVRLDSRIGTKVSMSNSHNNSNAHLFDSCNSGGSGPTNVYTDGPNSTSPDDHDHTAAEVGGNGIGTPPYATPHDNQPPFFNVVYIMRIV